jgi:hypothetical protein
MIPLRFGWGIRWRAFILLTRILAGASHDGRKRPLLARGLGVDAHWLPIPWQELVEAVGGVTVGHALQYVSEIGKGLDVVSIVPS